MLAIDPSSPFSGGAILGDRVRMQDHATDPGVFIRSMATRGHLGGLSLATPQAVRVLDAAGKPWVLIETVGVGQVEIEVAGAADTTMVVVNPGWGDAVQAAKAGLLEIADLFVVNKADRDGAAETVRDLEFMLDLSLDAGPHGTAGARRSSRPSPPRARASRSCGRRSVPTGPFLESDGRLAARRTKRIREELKAIVVERLYERAGEVCWPASASTSWPPPSRPARSTPTPPPSRCCRRRSRSVSAMAEFITTERRDNGVELIRFNRPPMNALSAELLAELADHVEGLAGDADLKAVVRHRQRPGLRRRGRDQPDPDRHRPLIGTFRRAFDGLEAIPRPVIAAISGFALGGGLEAALACDLRLASENARLGVPEILLGVFPGAGGTQRLPRLIGPARAKELIWTRPPGPGRRGAGHRPRRPGRPRRGLPRRRPRVGRLVRLRRGGGHGPGEAGRRRRARRPAGRRARPGTHAVPPGPRHRGRRHRHQELLRERPRKATFSGR